MKPFRWAMTVWTVFLLAAATGAATEPTGPLESLRAPIERIIKMLNDPLYEGAGSKQKQRDDIWVIARPIFDFAEISKRAIGKPWLNFTASEKSRFTAVFSEFLGSTYIDKLQGEYNNETIDFEKELVKGSVALVRTKLRRDAVEIPIDYRMKRIDGTWKVYDIIVENGVSLIKNYRVQFTSILQKESPGQLIQQLESKLAQQTGQTAIAN
jgi:phospholipid transport system substrate-binding protein